MICAERNGKGPASPGKTAQSALPPSPVRSDPARLPASSGILSDADPETWTPGAEYAQNSIRRSGGGIQWRDLSPVEGMRVFMYDNAFRTLRELEPDHPQLKSMSTSTWVPTFQDARRLNEEIARIRAQRGSSGLEEHHNYPRQFESNFRACGIEPEDYKTILPRAFHRLSPDGLHAGSINWNPKWKTFLIEHPNPRPEQLFEQIHNMWINVPWSAR